MGTPQHSVSLPKKKFVRKLIFFICLVFLVISTQVNAQRNVQDSVIQAFMFQADYTLQLPAGDLTTQFGVNSTLGGAVLYKTNQNWLWGTGCDFLFGDQVKNRSLILSRISTIDGEVIDGNGTFTSLALFERGFHLYARFGKIFKGLQANPNSGVLVMTGLGYLQHRIRIETQFGTAPQIMDDYAKGYDKLRGGPAVQAELGYFMMSNSRVFNFSATLELVHVFSKNLRSYDFQEMQYTSDALFNDNFIGLKIRWMIPTYSRDPQKYYYN